jgi:hypothetical protein
MPLNEAVAAMVELQESQRLFKIALREKLGREPEELLDKIFKLRNQLGMPRLVPIESDDDYYARQY